MERPYVFMQRALVTFKAAGLHSPLAGPAQEEFWLQLWVERYGALEAGLFTGCVKKLAGERYFPRLHDMDEAVQDAQKGCCWQGGVRRSTGRTVMSLICLTWRTTSAGYVN